MNDSFLEDLELVPSDVKNVNAYPVDRHITTRTATSSPLQHTSKSKGENVLQKVEQAVHIVKQSAVKQVITKERKMSEHDMRKHQAKVKAPERKSTEAKLKPIENKVKVDGKEQEIKDDVKAKVRESRMKSTENKVILKERTRRSGSHKENTQASDVKENSRPSDPSKEGTSQAEVVREKTKTYDTHKTVEFKETDSTMLNSIKEIVSICTKQESTKILRAMQELHFNSQGNLIKHLLSQTDDIISEMHPSKDSIRVRSLIELNERLQEDNIVLQKRNEELQKKLEELEHLKQENAALKLKCKELSKQ